MNTKNILLSLFLLLAVLSSSFFTYSLVHKTIAPPKPLAQGPVMDFFMRNVHYVEMDANGKPLHYLDSPLVKHYQNQDSYAFTTPRIKTADAVNLIWFNVSKI